MEVRQDFERRTGARIVEGYGLSDFLARHLCQPAFDRGEDRIDRVAGSRHDLRGRLAGGPQDVLPPGEIGELTFTGPQVMMGYWNRPDATAETIIDKRLHTGDVGRIDQDGYVFVTDRLKEMIIASGFKTDPRNVEEAIYTHPSVRECAVIGVGDPYRGRP